jgi:hypothetical protein
VQYPSSIRVCFPHVATNKETADLLPGTACTSISSCENRMRWVVALRPPTRQVALAQTHERCATSYPRVP